MRRDCFLFLLAVLLASGPGVRPVRGAVAPTAAMFRGEVTVVETGGLSLQECAADAWSRIGAGSGGGSFFTAWAFPVCEALHSCRRHGAGAERGPLAIRAREGRIVVNPEHDRGLNLSDGPGATEPQLHWGVLLFLHQVDGGCCRIRDVKLLAPDRECDLGGGRLFWLGTADEARGLEFIRGLLRPEGGRDLRKRLVFVLYMFSGSRAVSDLIGLARRDPDPAVRKDAIFWLGQKASQAAVRTLGEVIASPESLEIKKQAIFALSQMDEDKGTPLLLDIARKNPHPALRKQAIFWLGQSGDPRALDFFESILLH
ncbi:MAG: HEAT repeat domain-containing protein [Candidatus Aminicenantes bacterium]|nr:HEAT repeat domain-containing protein [Candidatus Aminicenantes bacterium]